VCNDFDESKCPPSVNALGERHSKNAQTSTDSSTAGQSSAAPDPSAAVDPPEGLFRVAKLNESLPIWLRIGGQYRGHIESPTGIGFTRTPDFYLLDRLRVHAKVQSKDWLIFYGEVQDARIFSITTSPTPTLSRTLGRSGKATLR